MRKKPVEVFRLNWEFGANMLSTETLNGYEMACTDRNGEAHPEMIVEGTIVERTRVPFKIQGGTVALSPYRLTVVATTSMAQVFQIDEDVIVY